MREFDLVVIGAGSGLDVAATIQDAGQFGIDAEITDTDFAGMVRAVNESVAEDSQGIQ